MTMMPAPAAAASVTGVARREVAGQVVARLAAAAIGLVGA